MCVSYGYSSVSAACKPLPTQFTLTPPPLSSFVHTHSEHAGVRMLNGGAEKGGRMATARWAVRAKRATVRATHAADRMDRVEEREKYLKYFMIKYYRQRKQIVVPLLSQSDNGIDRVKFCM